MILPLVPSSEIVAGTALASVETPFADKKIFWMVIMALLRLVGMVSHCANVTPIKTTEALTILAKMMADFLDIRDVDLDEAVMGVVMIQNK